jgi:hypothetical protein
MRKALFWIYQFTAWSAVAVMALVLLLWEPGMKSPSPPGIFPVRSFDVHIDKGAYEPFIAQMRKFGETFGFRILIKPGSPRPYDMYFQMWRHEVDLLASNDSDTGAPDLKFGVGFYPKRGQPPPSSENIAPLTEGLRRYLAEVPSASISDATPLP